MDDAFINECRSLHDKQFVRFIQSGKIFVDTSLLIKYYLPSATPGWAPLPDRNRILSLYKTRPFNTYLIK